MDVGAFDDAAILESCPPAYVGSEAYRNKGDDVRKLLEEVRDFIRYSISALPMGEKDFDKAENIFNKIDAALAAPEPNVVEILRQVRQGSVAGHTLSSNYWNLTDSEAAALIERRSKQVPRAMLEDVWHAGVEATKYGIGFGMTDDINTISAKYGYRAE